jgi:hypothetical protein
MVSFLVSLFLVSFPSLAANLGFLLNLDIKYTKKEQSKMHDWEPGAAYVPVAYGRR